MSAALVKSYETKSSDKSCLARNEASTVLSFCWKHPIKPFQKSVIFSLRPSSSSSFPLRYKIYSSFFSRLFFWTRFCRINNCLMKNPVIHQKKKKKNVKFTPIQILVTPATFQFWINPFIWNFKRIGFKLKTVSRFWKYQWTFLLTFFLFFFVKKTSRTLHPLNINA